MTAKEFLTSKKVFYGLGVCEDNTTGNTHKIADLMEEYHQAKLKLLGIANVVGRSEQLNTNLENEVFNNDKDWATNDDVDEHFRSV